MNNETKIFTREEICEQFGDDIIFADGFDSAIIGIACGHDSGRVVYDYEKMVEACMSQTGMSYEDSIEWVEFNAIGSYIGKETPIYVDRPLL